MKNKIENGENHFLLGINENSKNSFNTFGNYIYYFSNELNRKDFDYFIELSKEEQIDFLIKNYLEVFIYFCKYMSYFPIDNYKIISNSFKNNNIKNGKALNLIIYGNNLVNLVDYLLEIEYYYFISIKSKEILSGEEKYYKDNILRIIENIDKIIFNLKEEEKKKFIIEDLFLRNFSLNNLNKIYEKIKFQYFSEELLKPFGFFNPEVKYGFIDYNFEKIYEEDRGFFFKILEDSNSFRGNNLEGTIIITKNIIKTNDFELKEMFIKKIIDISYNLGNDIFTEEEFNILKRDNGLFDLNTKDQIKYNFRFFKGVYDWYSESDDFINLEKEPKKYIYELMRKGEKFHINFINLIPLEFDEKDFYKIYDYILENDCGNIESLVKNISIFQFDINYELIEKIKKDNLFGSSSYYIGIISNLYLQKNLKY